MNQNEYIENCLEMYDFSLHAAEKWRSDHPGETLAEILRNRTLFSWLLRNSAFECRIFPVEAEKLLSTPDSGWNEETLKFRRLLPDLAAANYPGALQDNPEYVSGRSVRYDRPHEDVPRNWCVIHMWNAIKPKSFLNEEKYFAKCLIEVMDEAEQQYGYDTLYTFSWLNSEPRYLHYFSEEWQRNLSEPNLEINATQGFLGQFITAKNILNHRIASEYLTTGVLPFKPRSSHCSFSAERAHLKSFL